MCYVVILTQFEAVCVCVQKIERDSPDLICSLLVPSRPLKVIFKEVTNSSVAVHWQQPTTPNGIIVGYRIYYMHDNFTDVQTVRHTEPNMFHVLRGLSKYFLMTDCYYAVSKYILKSTWKHFYIWNLTSMNIYIEGPIRLPLGRQISINKT